MPFGELQRECGLPVQAGLENREHRAARWRTNDERALAGDFEALLAVLAGEPQQAKAGPVAHFGMRTVAQQVIDDGLSTGADRGAPVQKATRCPFHVGTMCRWHVLGHRCMCTLEPASRVCGDTFAAG